tara:strand:- start:282 stop:671 length:390 start_codon:yes stop_codon:yes gene_type:complete
MKNFVKRKPYGGQRKMNSSRVGVADSPYLQVNGNSNGFKRNGKNPKDQYNDYLIKAKDAKGQGDDVLEQFYLQHAEHYFRQTDNSNKGFVARKIINRDKSVKSDNDINNDGKEEQKPASDFDDLASQLA